jgi:hypothetical protein
LTVDRNQLFKALESYGIPEKIIKLTLSDNIAKVLIANTSNRSFNILTGVRQGDARFNIALNMVLGGIVEKGNVTYKSTQPLQP